jgi:transcriptional regulator with XRE-family HTH domain
MLSVGAHLRQLREARGISLEEIARATRVNTSYLHALEAEDWAELPVPVFTRGFIRAYCQALGEAPDESLAMYEGRAAAVAPSPSTTPAVPTARPAASSARPPAAPPPRNRGPVLVSFVLLVVLGVALFALTLALQSGRESPEDRRAARAPAASARPVETPAVGATPQAPAAPGAPPAPSTAAPPRPAAFRLVARTLEPTWMRVRTEDGKTTEETIPAGQVREWVSTGPFTLTVGNAGGVTLELNGRALPSLGPSGVVIPRLVVPTELQ